MGTYPLRVGINTGEVVSGPRSKINRMGAAGGEMAETRLSEALGLAKEMAYL